MHQHSHQNLRELRQRVTNANYRVDSHAVAEAIVRRRWKIAIAAKPAQTSVVASPAWDRVHALAA